MDGVFLFRPELVPFWDFKIFVEVDCATAVARAVKRDGYYLGAESEIVEMYHRRYIPGQNIYFNEVRPKDQADIVMDNRDFGNPFIVG